MTLPLSGPMKLSEVLAEFVAPWDADMSSLVRGGAYVPDSTDNTDFGNSGIPTTTPLSLTDFYGGQDIPDPCRFVDVSLDGINGGYRYISADQENPLISPLYSGAIIPVPAENQFCIDVEFNYETSGYDPDVSDEIVAGGEFYEDCELRSDIYVGMTLAPPGSTSANALASFWGVRIRFWQAGNSPNGVSSIQWVSGGGGNKSSFWEGFGYSRAVPEGYPGGQTGKLRLKRGHEWFGPAPTRYANWELEIYGNSGGFLGSVEHTDNPSTSNPFPFNSAGYLCVITGPAEPGSRMGTRLIDVRGYAGGSAPAWSY